MLLSKLFSSLDIIKRKLIELRFKRCGANIVLVIFPSKVAERIFSWDQGNGNGVI